MKESFQELIDVMRKLRKECPWDKEQTIESLMKNLQDEVDEVKLALKNNDMENFKEELGDVVVVIGAIAAVVEEKGHFELKDSLKGAKEKMIRRHPHVYGKEKANSAQEALEFFYKAKEDEKIAKAKLSNK